MRIRIGEHWEFYMIGCLSMGLGGVVIGNLHGHPIWGLLIGFVLGMTLLDFLCWLDSL